MERASQCAAACRDVIAAVAQPVVLRAGGALPPIPHWLHLGLQRPRCRSGSLPTPAALKRTTKVEVVMMATVKAAVVVVVRRQQKKRAAATALIAVTHQHPANKLRPVKCQRAKYMYCRFSTIFCLFISILHAYQSIEHVYICELICRAHATV